MRFFFVLGMTLHLIAAASAGEAAAGADPTRQRVIILADMGNEPDEEQQMAHMLVNCNEFDLEGLIAVTGKYLNEHARNEEKRHLHPELFHKLIDAYAKVEGNLRLHADGWPAADRLRNLVRSGQRKYGLADTGEGKSSPGSELIVRALKSGDPRPLNIVVNAGSNTLAQALIDLRATEPDGSIDRLVTKLRVFENGAQDDCGAWICRQFPAVHWVRSNHQTYGYMGESRKGEQAAGPHAWKPHPRTHQGQHRWAEVHIMRDHGPLGEAYPYRFNGNGFLEGGGTIPWLGYVNKGLYDVDHPSWGGWSGRFSGEKQKNVWSRHASVRQHEETYGDFFAYTEVADTWTDPADGTVYENRFTPVWRWRQAMLNNCQARFDWCVKDFKSANHHPVAAIGDDSGNTIIRRNANPGDTVTFDASGSSDPDRDALHHRWYFYPEACGSPANLPALQDANTPRCRFRIPDSVSGAEWHLILEVTDQSRIVPLCDYRRIVLTIPEC